MRFPTLISSFYGELRGYHRLRIRRRALANEKMTRAELDALTNGLLQGHVRRSLERFPAYAERVRAHRGSLPGPDEPIRIEELPIWTRDDQRDFFDIQERPADASYAHQTSGSTGRPVRFYITRESYEWRTAVMDRSYGWAMAEEGSPSVYLWAGGQDHQGAEAPTGSEGASSERPRVAAERRAEAATGMSARAKRLVHLMLQRRTFYDAFRNMGPEELAEICALINRTRPTALVGYTGVLVDVARYVRDHPGALERKPQSLVTAAEALMPGQRGLLEAHLVDEVFLSYGSREFMNVGMECSAHNGYHVVTDNVFVEVVGDDGRQLPSGETGRIVITDLRNAATPFIRYEIGDLGVMAPHDKPCSCGRPFPLLRSVEGRAQDMIRVADGSNVTSLFVTYTVRQFEWIEGYQVVQYAPDHIALRILTPEELTADRNATISRALGEKLGGGMRIEVEKVDELERSPSGKVDLVISRMDDARGEL